MRQLLYDLFMHPLAAKFSAFLTAVGTYITFTDIDVITKVITCICTIIVAAFTVRYYHIKTKKLK